MLLLILLSRQIRQFIIILLVGSAFRWLASFRHRLTSAIIIFAHMTLPPLLKKKGQYFFAFHTLPKSTRLKSIMLYFSLLALSDTPH
jgi:succinate dehydrogenase/fumarate reductase cytochrome b subunit